MRMKIYTYLITLLVFLFVNEQVKAERGDIVFVELMQEQSLDELSTEIQNAVDVDANLLGLTYDIVIHKIAYETLDYDGISPTTATGVIAYPSNYECPAPMLTYGHGLTLKHSGLPSAGSIYTVIAKGMASNGYITLAPDYIHMGVDASPGFQAFMHSDSEAAATIDLIRAARTYCQQNDIVYNDELFLSGYSQGGHSSMATCKEIQENYSDEFQITAAMPGGGTYDLSGIAADSLASPTRTTGEPHALCLVVKSYITVYADSLKARGLDYTMNDIFQHPYDSLLNHILDPNDPYGSVAELLPVPNMMLEEEFRLAFLNDPDYFIRDFLSYNNLYDWAPQMKMRIFHSTADVENPYPNLEFTYNRFLELGAPDVELSTIDFIGHSDAGLFHVLELKNWFNELKEPCIVGVEETVQSSISAFPSPFTNTFTLDLKEQAHLYNTIELYDIKGQLLQTFATQQQTQVQINTAHLNLSNGRYILLIKGQEQQQVLPLIRIERE